MKLLEQFHIDVSVPDSMTDDEIKQLRKSLQGMNEKLRRAVELNLLIAGTDQKVRVKVTR